MFAVAFAFRCHFERSEESLFQCSREPYCRSQRRPLAFAVDVRCHPEMFAETTKSLLNGERLSYETLTASEVSES
jgi:hypothetical protein